MKVRARDAADTFSETDALVVAIESGHLSIELTESRSIRDLTPEIKVYLRVRGLEIRVRSDGSVNVSNIGAISVGAPITIRGRD
jgi:hypothetical protein